METFDLTKGFSVLIYGAGAYGKSVYGKVKNIYNVRCLADKRVSSAGDIDVPVRDPEHISEYKDCTVLVCVHDGNWHYEIAEELSARGFEKIIFCALNDIYRETAALSMNKIYNLFMEEQYDFLKGIPYYGEMKGTVLEENIIRKNEKYVTAYCSRELLYSYDKIDEHQKSRVTQELLEYWDVPMSAYKPFTSLFRYFMFGEGDSELYVRNLRRMNNSFDMEEDEFLQSQYLIYLLMEKQYEKGMEALQYAPIEVKWNARGYFNVVDGHHRCTFYYLKGMQYVPVRMTRDDYEIWMNAAAVDRVKEIINRNADAFCMKISHPLLGNCRYRYIEYEKTTLDIMQEWIYEGRRRFDSVLELSECQAYYSRNMYRMKRAQKITALVCSAKDREAALALNELQYIPDTAVVVTDSIEECLEKEAKYDLAVMCRMFDVHELERVAVLLDQKVSDAIFWQSKTDIHAEKEYILQHSGFHDYKKLAVKCINGRLSEIGVFSKG